MSATARIRLGAAIVIAGEVFGLATMRWPTAATFVAFLFGASVMVLAGAVLGTWGVLEHGDEAPRPHARRGEEAPHPHARHGD